MPKNILISEIFGPTIQGEGALIGKPTVFVRTAGCDYECRWCDTLYAVLPDYKGDWTPTQPAAILDEVARLSGGHSILVTVSGGNPALQPLEPLLDLGRERGFTFALETQGSVARPWFAKLDYLALSPKPPSSGMAMDWAKLADCVTSAGNQARVALKIVVFDETDYKYARAVSAALPHLPVYLQVGTVPQAATGSEPVNSIEPSLNWLLGRVTSDGWNDVTVLPQLHVLLWGHKRGV